MESLTKTCSECKEIFPATEEYFYKSKNRKDGLRYFCKKCWNEKSREYRRKNKGEPLREYRKLEIKDIRNYSKEYSAMQRISENGPRIQFLKNIHKRIKRNKPRSEVCTICNEVKKLELSNISGEYKNDISDYWYLCKECHILFDKTNKTHKRGKSDE